MARTSHVVDVTEATFERDVVQRSREVPVVVDFWAAWCGPCRTLGPLLERLAEEADGAWLLAKVDVDTNQALSARFGIRGIPAVKAFEDGRMVDEFVGALPEAQVRAFLARLGPSPADLDAEAGARAEEAGDLEAAAELYRRALTNAPAHAAATAGLARVETRLRAATVDEAPLRARLEADPLDVDAATALSDADVARGDVEPALARLVALVRDTAGEDRERARLHLLRLLDALPADDPRALDARRRLAAALF